MVRTLALAALVTLFGAGASQAQYQDSAPPPEGYDEELLGPYEQQQYDDDQPYDDRYSDDRYSDHGYSRPDVDVGIFANLSNGSWFMSANFGWVWRPYAATSWRPYTNGRWVWTSYGWTWVSYEPFGWATYHYGYWNCDAALGWVWIPGYEWSACRVQWAYYDNYVAWAPMYPPGYSCPRPFTTAGFNIWFTIGASHFCDPYPTRYCVTSYDNVYTQRVAYKSPGRTYVQQYTRTPIRESSVSFKHTKAVRGSNGFSATHSQSQFKAKGYSRNTQPYVQNSRPNVQSKQKYNTGSQMTRDSRTFARNEQPQRAKQKYNTGSQVTRDSRTFARNEQPQRAKQQFKKSSSQRNYVDARAMQQRQREPGVTRQYQQREVKRSLTREATRSVFESHQKSVARSTGRSSHVTRDVASTHEAQRSVTKGNSKQSRGDVAKMKGGNGRGSGKH